MIRKFWARLRNPHNLTRLHHAAEAARFGDRIGDFTYGRLRIRRWGEGARLHIGPYCQIADGVTVYLGGNHRTDWISTYPFAALKMLWPGAAHLPTNITSRGDVVIGADVWIGSGATILSGVTIEPGAVIGTAAVVTRDIPAYAIAAGNPAQIIRLRFGEANVAALLAARWWDRPPEEVALLAPLLHADNIPALLDALALDALGAQQAGGADA